MSLVCAMSEGQTRIVIITDFSLVGSDIRVYNGDDEEVSMTDMLVHSPQQISIFLEPGDVYTIRLGGKRVMLYPVIDTRETLYANLFNANFNSGWIEAYTKRQYVENQSLRAMQ